jgi:hypothetical protein
MNDFEKSLHPNRDGFNKDPFGYSLLARQKWGLVRSMAGFPVDISKPATSEELKNPILWLSQAHALSKAAVAVIGKEQNFNDMPIPVRSICDSQYCAVGLMLIGYSLEICLKAMLIIREGIEGYKIIEKKTRHHRLQDLANFVPDLKPKDIAILKGLTHFVYWAGRYPDPGSGRENNVEEIFNLGEKHQVTHDDLFNLSTRVMKYVQEVTPKL